jgi:hypothetical protein
MNKERRITREEKAGLNGYLVNPSGQLTFYLGEVL